MTGKAKSPPILICDANLHTRRLVADVLAGAGFDRLLHAAEGHELLQLTAAFRPRIVITASRIPSLSGLEFTRLIRDGYEGVDRATSVIAMTDTPTEVFLEAARESGVDEMLRLPFTGAALLARVEAVLLRPRRFIESLNYVGPCRRRRMLEDYEGPMRRFTDPLESLDKPLWEAASNRELVRNCVTKLSELSLALDPSDRRKLREIYAAVSDAELLADEVRDQAMGDSARSLARYIGGVGATGRIDPEVVSTHIDAMQQLALLGSDCQDARGKLVTGLIAVVNKRLGRGAGRNLPLALPAPARRAI